MGQLFWIAVAGGAGTALRYGITMFAARQFGAAYPYGTLAVNIAGCFAIAACVQLAVTAAWPSAVRSIVIVGFLGGLTTYSSFNQETIHMVQEGASASAVLHVLITIVGGLAAGWLGLIAARALTG